MAEYRILHGALRSNPKGRGAERFVASRTRLRRDGNDLHRFEAMREGSRNGELFLPRAQRDDRLVAPIAFDARDRPQIDDRAAMDLPEGFGIELLVEFLDRLFDQRLAALSDDFRVLVFGLKI